MSWSFPCTPCGFDHAGECEVLRCGCKGRCKGHVDQSPPALPPNRNPQGQPVGHVTVGPPYPPTTTPGWTATIAVGSRWKLMHQNPGSQLWCQDGWKDGYEVMAVVANGFMVAIQMREWNSPAHPVYTCALKWWEPDGAVAFDGGANRFDPWT